MLHLVILAGGSGTRFWPASRSLRPKQLLNLAGEQSMLQSTVSRLGSLASSDRILIVTNQRLADPIRAQLPELPPESVLGEPCKRDTAPCIGVAAAWVSKNDPDAVMACMPADHVISPNSAFQEAIQQAVKLVEDKPTRLVTFGIKPSYPAESFGYIERGKNLETTSGPCDYAFRVSQFKEKPTADVAQKYLDAGTFYWNSGIFVWKAKTILDLLEKYEPAMYGHIAKIGEAIGTPHFYDVFQTEFEKIEGTSIDYAVMERAEEVAVIEAPFDWDDVGSWTSLERLHETNGDGNTLVGQAITVDTTNSVIRSEGDHLVATVGVKDLIIVHTSNATLVAHRDNEEAVRKIVKQLEAEGMHDYL